MQRQRDLEYELGRAWEELERVEAAAQHQRAQHEVATQQSEAQLAAAQQVGRPLVLHESCCARVCGSSHASWYYKLL